MLWLGHVGYFGCLASSSSDPGFESYQLDDAYSLELISIECKMWPTWWLILQASQKLRKLGKTKFISIFSGLVFPFLCFCPRGEKKSILLHLDSRESEEDSSNGLKTESVGRFRVSSDFYAKTPRLFSTCRFPSFRAFFGRNVIFREWALTRLSEFSSPEKIEF